ncbi:ankyrin repeat domain-containing protein [Trichocoleus sp. FACHB-591]|uniref:ankyrin repeat domain-containing protein n=1 Tax=Trichocoleus sp. FACHB-591 TaxID=2692872 RepID=UPI001683125B|nr:ankyrin repeat domain-containing protein [Trichocoleus sp. FACHB-591]MBD2098365.1 ankyrin repeat domain-containing protein [Trichocoleus sp. FACHB-591]
MPDRIPRKKINRCLSKNSVAIALATLLAACGYRVSFTPPSQPKATSQLKQQPTLTPIEALEAAFFNKDFAQAKRLLKSVPAQDIERSELMLRAVQTNQPELIQLMIKRGADPNANDGVSPLRQAVRTGNDPLVQLLLKHGADPNQQDGNTDSILQEALFSNSYISFLDWTSHIDRFPQVSDQGMETIRFILKGGANPNDRDRANGTTVLMVAAGHGNEKLVELLLQQGANAKAANAYGENALHYAAWRGNPAIVQRLLSEKVNVNPIHHLGRTPLMFAVRRGSLPIVKLLLAQGARVDAASRETFVEPDRLRYGYYSVLDHAIATNQPEIAALLKQKGAKPYEQK